MWRSRATLRRLALNEVKGLSLRKVLFLLLLFLPALWLALQITLPGYTRLELTDAETGRKTLVVVLSDGEQVVLTWHNSLFNLDVTEVFVAESGWLIQTEVTFADPRGVPPMHASPQDLDDLYHTGGPFTVQGLRKPFARIVYRVGEIGEPKMRVGDRVVEFKREVGFGGGVVLTVQTATLCQRLFESW
jgi:hypothetical protein